MKVLHDVECPVWTHPVLKKAKTDTKRGISKILCSIELGDEAIPLLRFTKEIAADFGASVRLVHCVPEIPSIPAKYFDYDLHQSVKESVRDDIAKLQQEAGTDFPLQITEHYIAQDVAEAATNWGADLVIIGRGKAQEVFGTLRTHAYDIVRESPCPVLSFSMTSAHSKSLDREHQELKAEAAR